MAEGSVGCQSAENKGHVERCQTSSEDSSLLTFILVFLSHRLLIDSKSTAEVKGVPRGKQGPIKKGKSR